MSSLRSFQLSSSFAEFFTYRSFDHVDSARLHNMTVIDIISMPFFLVLSHDVVFAYSSATARILRNPESRPVESLSCLPLT